MKVRGKAVYAGVLDIPAQHVDSDSGNWDIVHVKHDAGYCLPLANTRTMLLGNPERGSVEFKEPTRWHELHQNGYRWMSDYPIEQVQHDRELKGMRGSVLVGGLGLGYAATVLALRKSVELVTVVELESAVIHMVAEATRKNIARLGGDPSKLVIVQGDLFEYLKDPALKQGRYPMRTTKFDHAFYDIWASDSEGTFFDVVQPLRSMSLGIVKHEPVNWNETIMRGQLCMSLHSRRMMLMLGEEEAASWFLKGVPDDRPGARFVNWSLDFFRWVEQRKPDDEQFGLAAKFYAEAYGRWAYPASWQSFITLSAK